MASIGPTQERCPPRLWQKDPTILHLARGSPVPSSLLATRISGQLEVSFGGTVESTAKKCVQWGVILVVAGGFVLVLLPQLLGLLTEAVGPTAAIGVGAVDIVLTLVRWALIPMGTTLIGAAVVIRALAPALDRPRDVHTGA